MWSSIHSVFSCVAAGSRGSGHSSTVSLNHKVCKTEQVPGGESSFCGYSSLEFPGVLFTSILFSAELFFFRTSQEVILLTLPLHFRDTHAVLTGLL